ncbi:MAG: hypothetical protein U9Q69_03765 [Nanoarchaeota archaeon]|nr:hypothetical protein [Nanoarchaeota archaeon]
MKTYLVHYSSIIKKRLLKLFFIDLFFFFLLGSLFLIVRKYVTHYLVLLMGYGNEVAALTQVGDNSLLLQKASSLTVLIEPLTQKLQLWVYLILPLGLFIIWVLVQGLRHNQLNGKKIFCFQGFKQMACWNLPIFIILFLLVDFIFKQITLGHISIIVILSILVFVVLYLAHLVLPLIEKVEAKKIVLKICKISFKDFWIFFLLVIINILLFLISFGFLWNILIKIVAFSGKVQLSLVALFISIFIWESYRIFLFFCLRKKILKKNLDKNG